MTIRLFIEYSDKSQILDLANKIYIFGRSKSADICIPDPLISSKHLEIKLERNSEIFVKDLESSNGTYINGSKTNSQRLFIGDQLVIGKTLIRLDTNSMNPTEYKAFFNEERTSIRFIDAGVKTASIQRSIFDEEPAKEKKSSDDIHEDKTRLSQAEIQVSRGTPKLEQTAMEQRNEKKPVPTVKKINKIIKKKEKTSILHKILPFLKK